MTLTFAPSGSRSGLFTPSGPLRASRAPSGTDLPDETERPCGRTSPADAGSGGRTAAPAARKSVCSSGEHRQHDFQLPNSKTASLGFFPGIQKPRPTAPRVEGTSRSSCNVRVALWWRGQGVCGQEQSTLSAALLPSPSLGLPWAFIAQALAPCDRRRRAPAGSAGPARNPDAPATRPTHSTVLRRPPILCRCPLYVGEAHRKSTLWLKWPDPFSDLRSDPTHF